VNVFICAGISPNAALNGETALALSIKSGFKDVSRLLLDAGANPVNAMDGLTLSPKTKDAWEKLSSISGVFTFIATLFVAGIGWYFTNSYNERQLELSQSQALRDQESKEYQHRLIEMQTVEKMIPHLVKDEKSKQAALIAISALGSPRLAARIAEVYGGQGSINALTQLATEKTGATSSTPAISALTNIASREKLTGAKPAHQALAKVFDGTERSIVKVSINGRAICNGFVVAGKKGWMVSPAYCFDLDRNLALDKGLQVQLINGTSVKPTQIEFRIDGLLAFLKMETRVLPELTLSTKKKLPGENVTQLAFDLSLKKSGSILPTVVLGKVVESGQMSFIGSANNKEVKAMALVVELDVGEKALGGTAGGPLLDGEGNVACMTFQGTSQGLEQCLDANEILKAMETLP
jgi:hypothetical protein